MNKRLDAMVMLNMADPFGQDNRDAAEMLSGTPIRYLDAPIGNRKAFSNAGSAGRSVLEMQPRDPKACREFEALGGRGRDGSCDPPPAQIPACPIRAPGSYLG
jgi:chromosome partitioning protein